MPKLIALASSTSIKSCGTVGLKNVLMPARRGSFLRASINKLTAANKCNGSVSLRL